MPTKPAVLSRTALRAQTALATLLMPRMATDAKLDLSAVLKGVNAKNFKAQKAKIWAGAKDAAKDKWAKDDTGQMVGAGPDDVAMRILDMIDTQSAAPGEAEADEMPRRCDRSGCRRGCQARQVRRADGIPQGQATAGASGRCPEDDGRQRGRGRRDRRGKGRARGKGKGSEGCGR